MQSTPDLSKIINVLMQNPTLISEIAALANQQSSAEANEEERIPEVKESVEKTVAPGVESRVENNVQPQKKHAHRKDLLNAMKPYLSETRRGALDSVASIFDILDVMMRKEL